MRWTAAEHPVPDDRELAFGDSTTPDAALERVDPRPPRRTAWAPGRPSAPRPPLAPRVVILRTGRRPTVVRVTHQVVFDGLGIRGLRAAGPVSMGGRALFVMGLPTRRRWSCSSTGAGGDARAGLRLGGARRRGGTAAGGAVIGGGHVGRRAWGSGTAAASAASSPCHPAALPGAPATGGPSPSPTAGAIGPFPPTAGEHPVVRRAGGSVRAGSHPLAGPTARLTAFPRSIRPGEPLSCRRVG